MSRVDSQLKIRLPADLKQKIELEALRSMRSMNAEIVARLESTFETIQARVARTRREEILMLKPEIDYRVARLHALATGQESPDMLNEVEILRAELDGLRFVCDQAGYEAAVMEGKVVFEDANNDAHYIEQGARKAK